MLVFSVYSAILVGKDEDRLLEFICEKDNSILISNVAEKFPLIVGLKFLNVDGTWTNVKKDSRKFFPPKDGWFGSARYFIVVEKEGMCY